MPTPPFSIYERPFSVIPPTKLMMPDGIFDNTLGEQLVGVYYTVDSFDPRAWGIEFDVRTISFSFEISPDSGIFIRCEEIVPHYSVETHAFEVARYNPSSGTFEPSLKPGQQFLKFFEADFSRAIPGKHRIRFKARVAGVDHIPGTTVEVPVIIEFPNWDIHKNIFVTNTVFNESNRTIEGICPEGTVSIYFNNIRIFPYLPPGQDPLNWRQFCFTYIYDQIEQIYTTPGVLVHPPYMLPKEFTATVKHRTPFKGVHGPQPFSDIAWKWVFIGIGAVLLMVGGVIMRRESKKVTPAPKPGDDPVFLGWDIQCGNYQPDPITGTTTSICGPVQVFGYESGWTDSDKETLAAAGDASIGTGASLLVVAGGKIFSCAVSDEIDPFLAGESRTPPAPDELTVKEVVKARIEYTGNPIPGEPFGTRMQWTFERHTNTGGMYTHTETWDRTNDFVTTDVQLNKTHFTVGEVVDDQVKITASFRDQHGIGIKGNKLYITMLIGAPNGDKFFIQLQDEDRTGLYTSSFSISSLMRERQNRYKIVGVSLIPSNDPLGPADVTGTWGICCIAQSVNDDPTETGKASGGKVQTRVLEARLGEDCRIRLNAHATFSVEWVIS